jgi:hypothetical protein
VPVADVQQHHFFIEPQRAGEIPLVGFQREDPDTEQARADAPREKLPWFVED